jgi:hypothetical protein
MFHLDTLDKCSWSSIVKLNERSSRNGRSNTERAAVLLEYILFLLKVRGWVQAAIEINYTVRNTYICVIRLR